MKILPLEASHLPAAAEIFVQHYTQQRQAVPTLPDLMTNPAVVIEKLSSLRQHGIALAAVEDDVLLAYMGCWVVDDFRDMGIKGAFCSEYGHAVREAAKPSVYASLYYSAAAQWAEAGCRIFGASLMAVDEAAREFWFWNNYGMLVVDAIRPIDPLDVPCPPGFSIHKAEADDAPLIAQLDIPHSKHYTRPPVWMIEGPANDEASLRSFLAKPTSNIWFAIDEEQQPVGFMRFEMRSHGAATIVQSPETIAITAVYMQPACRGSGVASAILDAALKHYAAEGFQHCSVDFESYNPPAKRFWMRYFEPVAYAVVRYPEALIAKS
jgi:GNAT superfamily N-acetyltransferase